MTVSCTEQHRAHFGKRFSLVEAAGRAVEEAIRDHKPAGNTIAEWRDGRVVLAGGTVYAPPVAR